MGTNPLSVSWPSSYVQALAAASQLQRLSGLEQVQRWVQEQVEVEVQRPLYAGPLGMAVADPLVAHHLLHPGVPGPVEVLGLVPEGASSTTNRL